MKTTQSKTKPFFSLLLAAAALGVSAPVWADHHCACDTKCADNCAQGKTDECRCKTCDCAKGKECSHGKCKHPSKTTTRKTDG